MSERLRLTLLEGELLALQATVACGSVLTGGVSTSGFPWVVIATIPGPSRKTFVRPPAEAPEMLPMVEML